MARRRSNRAWLVASVAGCGLVVAGVWYGWRREKVLEGRIADSQRQVQALDSQVNDYSRKLEASQEHAERVAQQAAEEAALRNQAEEFAQQARETAAAAESDKQAARAETEQARQQLDALRERREQELDRMQKALSQIAITRRTPSGMVMELADESFKFDFDSASLHPENREILSRIAGVLLASEGYRLYIYGHTDDVGTEDYNQGLSERRAKSVAGYLQKVGLPAEIMTTKGFGKSSPAEEGKTRAARASNRRVEIGVVDTIIDYKALADR